MATDIQSQLTGVSPQGVSINDSRRIFNFGERIAELAPEQSPFFSYLSKVAKKPTDDPVFKFLEKRHQWQRRNFDVLAEKVTAAYSSAAWALPATFEVDCAYDKYGREAVGQQPQFLLEGQVIAIDAVYSINGSAYDVSTTNAFDVTAYYRINAAPVLAAGKATIAATFLKAMYKPTGTAGQAASKKGQVPTEGGTIADASKLKFLENALGQVVGTNWAEGTDDPKGWRDEIYSSEGYTQIFKTAAEVTNTAYATRMRGYANEFERVLALKLREHKVDIERAMLFNQKARQNGINYTEGIIGQIIKNCSWAAANSTELSYEAKKSYARSLTAAELTYDRLLGDMEVIFDPARGGSSEKLCMASLPVVSLFNKMGDGFFVDKSTESSQVQYNIEKSEGAFGHKIMQVNTVHGDLYIVKQPLFRGHSAGLMLMADMSKLYYRPLVGNGVNRDTQVQTNVQAADEDLRKDMILTEAGLEVCLPEAHALYNVESIGG